MSIIDVWQGSKHASLTDSYLLLSCTTRYFYSCDLLFQSFSLPENCPYSEFSGRYFPAFGLNKERYFVYFVSLRIQSECGKLGTRNITQLSSQLLRYSLTSAPSFVYVSLGISCSQFSVAILNFANKYKDILVHTVEWTHLSFTYSKSAIESLEKGVKYVQS